MNIYDISAKAGVSIATVSRVLNGTGKVSEKTKKKVMDVIEETGFQPNLFARGLNLNTMHTIGILCADCSDIYLAAAVSYLERELRSHDYDALLCCTGYEYQNRQKYMQLLLSKKVDAIILIGSHFMEPIASRNQYILDAAKEVPIMLINSYLKGPNIYCTLCDDYEAMKTSTIQMRQFTDNILYLYRSTSYSGLRKLEGFCDAMELDENKQEQHILLFNGSIKETAEMLEARYQSGNRPKAILTSDDELAVGALKFAQSVNISVPDELQIVGYNNSQFGLCCTPEISSIDNRLEYSCINTVSSLMQLLEKKNVPDRTMVSAQFIERGTTQPGFSQ